MIEGDNEMRIHHVCIETTIYRESIEFYTKVLNFKLVKETPKKEVKLKNQDGEGLVHMCFYIENLKEELERIKRIYNNFKLKNSEILYTVEGGSLFKVIAPEGTIIEFRDNPLF